MKASKNATSISTQLMQLMFQAKHRASKLSEAYDLTVMQSGVIMMLNAMDPKPMRVMSDYFMCDASTITGLVDRLETRGLIQRQNHPTDRRIKLIGLTARGLKLKEEIQSKMQEVEDERLKTVLSDDERHEFMRLLDRVLDEPA